MSGPISAIHQALCFLCFCFYRILLVRNLNRHLVYFLLLATAFLAGVNFLAETTFLAAAVLSLTSVAG